MTQMTSASLIDRDLTLRRSLNLKDTLWRGPHSVHLIPDPLEEICPSVSTGNFPNIGEQTIILDF
jgi:hypothetical protein